MAKQFSREEILKNMREKIARKEALLVCGCGTGLIARLCDQAGVDLIGCYNTGRYRMNGIASIAGNLPIGNANEVMFDMAVKDILPVVKNTPVISGIFGLDPTRDMQRFLKSCYDIGLSGVQGFPTIGKIGGQIRKEYEQVGFTFEKEVSVLAYARKLNMLTMSYCYSVDEAKMIADAGIDLIIPHMGMTTGGDNGTKEQSPIDVAAEKTEAIIQAALSINPEIIPLCHGGNISEPKDAEYIMHHTSAKGFVGASSIERIPTEKAIKNVCAGYRAIRL